ncbi:MAG: PepSY domain-containing protein [Clostridia bacterium]|nr:PepSY domain-containing protein [Clostridia bacterium]
MRRKIIVFVSAIMLIVLSLVCFVACNKKGEEQECKDAVSRITREYYVGESELFAVTVEKGEREKNFIADGKATDVQPFAQITITPLKTNDYVELGYTLDAENDTLNGSIEKSEYGEYTATLTLDFVPATVTVTAGEETSEIDLVSVLDGALTPEDVINIAKEEFKETLDKEETTGREREIYVKIITGDRETYYYYVSFIGDGVDYLAVLIEPKTGKVVSKK